MTRAGDRLVELAGLLAAHQDVIEGRVRSPFPPAWCASRGWSDALLGLDEATLGTAELHPAPTLASCEASPPELRALARDVARLTRLSPIDPVEGEVIRGAGASKRAQVASLRRILLDAEARAERVVDYGAGRGHLTRSLAAALGRPAVGLERRPDVAAAARALGRGEDVRFVEGDATAGAVRIRATDLLVGLHACGALGDSLIEAARSAGASALLVPCCPQKVPGETREPLSKLGQRVGLTYPRPILGLANLGALEGGPVSPADATERRRLRYAVRAMLREAGHPVGVGEESRGINRKRFRGALAPLARAAFALRGLGAPSQAAIDAADQASRQEHVRVRQLSLPRRMLARPLELAIAFDRAVALEEASGEVQVVEAFARSVSPRNVAIIALAR